jgi:hypothetical protein
MLSGFGFVSGLARFSTFKKSAVLVLILENKSFLNQLFWNGVADILGEI